MCNTMRTKLLVIGSANMDFVSNTERLPEAGETITSAKNYSLVPGGKGANTALAAARLGAACTFCGRVGDDAYGEKLTSFYNSEDINTAYLRKSCHPTGLATIIVEGNGDNRIIVYPGANLQITTEDVRDAIGEQPEAVLCQLEIDYERVVEATRYCELSGIPVVLDAGPANKNLDLSRLGRLEIFTPNETETEIFTGIKPEAYQSCLNAAIKLSKMVTAKYIVIKLGKRGCFVYDGKYANFYESYKVNAVDTTAAGDSFTAALTLEYCRNGRNIAEAAKFANAVGALVVSKAGAAPSIPFLSEVKSFMSKRDEQ